MEVLDIVLIVLVIIGIWAVIEVALTMRSARRSIEGLAASASEVIGQAQPIVAKLDGIVDELEPASKEALPLLRKAETSLDAASSSLERVNGILEDVSSVSGTASTVTDAVNRAAESAASGVASVVSRLRGGSAAERAARLGEGDGPTEEEGPVVEQVPPRYVEYGAAAVADDAGNVEEK